MIKINESIQTVYLDKSKLDRKGLTKNDIDDITLTIEDKGKRLKITGDENNIWNVLHRFDLQYSTTRN